MANDVGLQLGDNGDYRIRCGGDFSEIMPLGEPIEWDAPNGKKYIAHCDIEGGAEESASVESLFEHFVYEAKVVPGVEEMEEVEFGEGGGGEEGEEEDDDEGEDEPPAA